MALDHYLDAAHSFEHAIAADPTMQDAYVQCAAAFRAAGDRFKADEMLNRFAQLKGREAVEPARVDSGDSNRGR